MKNRVLRIAGLVATALLAGCANMPISGGSASSSGGGSVIRGGAYALDGDSLIVDGQRLNLWAVDAPDFGNAQGWYSRAVLDQLIGRNGSLTCTIKRRSSTTDRALCSNSRSGDVALAMLRAGWAIVLRSERRQPGADTALLDAYDRAERDAMERRAGLWAGMPSR